MKILDLFSRKRLADPVQEVKTVYLHTDEIGSTGTKNFGGYSQEEYLSGLRGRLRAEIFDKMKRSDPQVKMCLRAVKTMILSGCWDIEPADDTPEAIKQAEFVEHVLMCDMDKPFYKILGEILTFVEHGFSLFEVVDKVVVGHPEFGDYNGIERIAFRSQRTIERWNIDHETEKLSSVSQYAYGDGQKITEIPAEFLLHFVVDQEGNNFEGISLLRPCYGNWLRKDIYLKLNAIGIEKFAIPTPLVKIPAGRSNTTEYENLLASLKKYVSHESAYLTYPDGYEITLQSNTYDPAKVEESINNEDTRMVKAFLANFLELGMKGSGGSYAMSNDLSDFFLAGLDCVANEVDYPFNHYLIPRLIKMNFGPQEKYPKLKHSGISDKAGKELAEVVQLLINSKAVIPDDDMEDDLRKRFGLSKKSDIGQRMQQPAPAPGQQPPGSNPNPGSNQEMPMGDMTQEQYDAMNMAERIIYALKRKAK